MDEICFAFPSARFVVVGCRVVCVVGELVPQSCVPIGMSVASGGVGSFLSTKSAVSISVGAEGMTSGDLKLKLHALFFSSSSSFFL